MQKKILLAVIEIEKVPLFNFLNPSFVLSTQGSLHMYPVFSTTVLWGKLSQESDCLNVTQPSPMPKIHFFWFLAQLLSCSIELVWFFFTAILLPHKLFKRSLHYTEQNWLYWEQIIIKYCFHSYFNDRSLWIKLISVIFYLTDIKKHIIK